MADANENDNGGDSSGLGGWGDNVADANPGAPSPPNASMSVEQQYAEYGAGRQAAERAAGYGAGGSDYSSTAGTVNAVAAADATTLGGILQEAARAVGAVLGLASGNPAGVLSGAAYVADRAGQLATPSPDANRVHDLGFSGNLGERTGTSTSTDGPGLQGSRPAGPVADGPGALEALGLFAGAPVQSSPVIGWQGSIVANNPVMIPTPVGQTRLASPARTTPTSAAKPAPSIAPLLLTAAAAYLIGA